MAFTYTLHPHDQDTLAVLRYHLVAARQAEGITQAQGGARIGKSDNFLYEMEGAKSTPSVAHLQEWAMIFNMRLEIQLEHFWLYTWPDDEVSMMYAMSRPFGRMSWQRMWLMAALQAWRRRQQISTTELGARLGMSRKGVAFWEAKSPDPLMGRAMVQARATGTAVQLRLWSREEWMFE